MVVSEIASSAEYRIDNEFQKFKKFWKSVNFHNSKNHIIFIIFQFIE